MGCYGGRLVPCSARHVRCNRAFFAHLQLMWTTLHPLNLCKNSFCDRVGVKSQNNEIWKSWSWSGDLNKTVARIQSGLFKMCWILPDSSPEIRILYTRDEHGLGLDRTGSGLKPILATSGLDRTAFLWKLANQDWIGLRKFLMFLCDYSEHIKTLSCDPILQIC